MSRVSRLQATAGALGRAVRLWGPAGDREACCWAALLAQPQTRQAPASSQLLRGLHTTTPAFQAAEVVSASDLEKATGLERQELEAKAKGIEDPYHEEWYVPGAAIVDCRPPAFTASWCLISLDAPFGTEDKPVQVTSIFSERVVGVPDPYDDSIIWWGKIHEGQPPKQIIEGGEFFVLKRIADDSGGH